MTDKNNEKCLHCEHIPCVNLFLEKDELDGGELFVLKEYINQKKMVSCQIGVHVYSCCKLLSVAIGTLNDDEYSPLLVIVQQCIYDLKTSAFLALTAHYRGAIQLLRSVIENMLVGLYFEEKLLKSKSEIDFDKWIEGVYTITEEEWNEIMGKSEEERKRRLGFGFLIEWLKKEKTLTGKTKQRFETAWGLLNKYLHPYFQYTDISKKECSHCPATVRYDKDRCLEWLKIFQNIIDMIIRTILTFYPNVVETDEGREALGHLKNLELEEKNLGMKTIVCPYLKDFISRLPSVNELFKNESPLERARTSNENKG